MLTPEQLRYNELLKKFNEAESFFENMPPHEIDRWLPKAKALVSKMAQTINEIKHYSQDDVNYGFGRQEQLFDNN